MVQEQKNVDEKDGAQTGRTFCSISRPAARSCGKIGHFSWGKSWHSERLTAIPTWLDSPLGHRTIGGKDLELEVEEHDELFGVGRSMAL